MGMLDPEDSACDDPEGTVVVAALVVAGRQRAELLTAGDQVLDPVAQPVDRAVEGAGPALGLAPRDGDADAPPPRAGADLAAGVALVARAASRAQTGPARARPAH